MSAIMKNDCKTKIPEDECVDSGFLSGPIDNLGDPEPETTDSTKESSKYQKTVLSDSGVITSELDSGVITSELDSGICDTLSECLSEVKLNDTKPSSTQTAQTEAFRCTVTSPQGKPSIPLEHLVIFFQPDDDGDTQLHIASVHGCEKSVGTLINICPNKELLDISNDQGYTPLHLAVMSGNAVVTRMLVRAGLSLGVRDRTGETPLHKATIRGDADCLQALLAPVHENPPRNLAPVLSQKNYNGQACVHLAASAGDLNTLQKLVFYGADVNVKENLAGWTALHIACRRGDVRMAQFLRARGGAAARARDHAGRAPRRLARHTPAARLFDNDDDSEDDDDSDDDYESDNESLFERLRDRLNSTSSINVA